MVADELGAPAGREFRLLYDWQNYGMSLPEALHRFGDRVALLDARFFVTSVLTQREVGGNLSEVLDNLSTMMRERFRVKRQIRVISAHGRMSGTVLGSIPPLLALYFTIVRPEDMRALITDPLGVRMLIGAVALQLLGVLIIRRLVDIEY
jgi:tight adherence protein B